MGVQCILNGCLKGLNLGFAINMFWRGLVTRKADKVITPSHYLQEEAVINSIVSNKINVIPHFTVKNPEMEYVEPLDDTILFIGRVDRLKGIAELLKALSLIRNKTWKAYVVGSGDGLIEYKKMAIGFGIEENIVFQSHCNYAELDEYYCKASVVVFPSMSIESFGLVGIEAMSFGRPVVAFDVGGPREWLIDGETGFLVQRGDVSKLASTIYMLLQDKCLASSMGKRGMERVAKYYRKDLHLTKIISVYEEVMVERS